MTYFENDNGDRIEISDDFSLTKSACNLFDFKLKGNSSTTFQVPNNSSFKKAFGYWSPLQQPSAGFIPQYFNLVRNGTAIDRGQLILEREDRDYLYFFFVSGNSNWLNLVPDISIKDIDYDEFAITFDSNISSFTAATSGFCYPLVDIGYKGQINTGISGTPSFSTLTIDNTGNIKDGAYSDLPPCFFLKSAMDRIFNYCQLKIGGDILRDPIYQRMVITPESGQIKRANKFYTDRKVSLSPSSNSAFGKINLDTVNENGGLSCWNPITQKYTANKACILTVKFNLNFNISCFSALKIYINGSLSQFIKHSAFIPDPSFVQNGNSTNFNSDDDNKYNTWDSLGGGSISAYIKELSFAVSNGDTVEFYADFGGVYKGGIAAGNAPAANAGDTYTITSNGTMFALIGGCTQAVLIGDVIQAAKNGAGNCVTDWLYFPIASGFNVLPQSVVTIEPRDIVQPLPYQYELGSTTCYDTLRASDILPDIKMMDLIKFTAQYFCAPPTFDVSTQTVNFNKMDNFDWTQAQDWSQYLQKWENNYSIQTARYNFIRFKQLEDPEVNALTTNNTLRYGDVLIQGQSSTKYTNDIYEIPFGATLDKFTKGPKRFLMPSIPLVDFEFDGDPIYINSASNSGGGLAVFNLASTPNLGASGNAQVFYVYGARPEYNGFITTLTSVGAALTTNLAFTKTTKGFVQPLRISFKSDQSRILLFSPSTSLSSFSDYSSVNAGSSSLGSSGYAYFSKPTSSYSVSSMKQGLNLDYYQGGYNDVPRRLDYYKNITRILNAPYIKMWFYLPESVFADFNMDRFVFIVNKDQQKFYYVDSIENYKDSRTLVQVNMLLLI